MKRIFNRDPSFFNIGFIEVSTWFMIYFPIKQNKQITVVYLKTGTLVRFLCI